MLNLNVNSKCVAKCKAKYLENIQIPNETTPASNRAAKIERQSQRQRQRQSQAGMAGSLGVQDIERVVIAAVRAALQGVAPPVQSTSATVS
jgi:hypothetical protein